MQSNQVKVSCGVNEIISELAGRTVASVRTALGNALNITADAKPFVNGTQVQDDHVLQGNSTLDFQRAAGEKGAPALVS